MNVRFGLSTSLLVVLLVGLLILSAVQAIRIRELGFSTDAQLISLCDPNSVSIQSDFCDWHARQFVWRIASTEERYYQVFFFQGELPQDRFEPPKEGRILTKFAVTTSGVNSLTINIQKNELGMYSLCFAHREQILVTDCSSWRNTNTDFSKSLYWAAPIEARCYSYQEPIILLRYANDSSIGYMFWLTPYDEHLTPSDSITHRVP